MWVFSMEWGPLPQTHMSQLWSQTRLNQTVENHNGSDAEARLDGTDSDKWISWDNESEHGGNSSSSQKIEPQKDRCMFKWWKHATGDMKLEQRFLLFGILTIKTASKYMCLKRV